MALPFLGVNVEKIFFNGVEVDTASFNGVEVISLPSPEIVNTYYININLSGHTTGSTSGNIALAILSGDTTGGTFYGDVLYSDGSISFLSKTSGGAIGYIGTSSFRSLLKAELTYNSIVIPYTHEPAPGVSGSNIGVGGTFKSGDVIAVFQNTSGAVNISAGSFEELYSYVGSGVSCKVIRLLANISYFSISEPATYCETGYIVLR